MPKEIVPGTDKIFQEDFPKVIILIIVISKTLYERTNKQLRL